MRDRTLRYLAVAILILSALFIVLGVGFGLATVVQQGRYANFVSHAALGPFMAVTFLLVGGLIVRHQPRNTIGWIYLVIGFFYCLSGVNTGYMAFSELPQFNGSLPLVEMAAWMNGWVWVPSVMLPITFVFLLFPDGHLLTPRWRWVAWPAGLGVLGYSLVLAFHPGPLPEFGVASPNPYGLPWARGVLEAIAYLAAVLLAFGVGGALASVVVRFRRSQGTEREQLKWLAYASGVVVAGFVLSAVFWTIDPVDPVLVEASILVSNFATLAIPIATGIAILRYRLYDIDLIINRTLVYGALTAIVVVFYILLVGSLSLLFQSGNNLFISLLATGLVAVLFQPLRQRLQQGVNRLMFGERDNPVAVLTRLSQQLEATISPEAVLPGIVESIAHALKLPYVAILVREGETIQVKAEYGLKPADLAGMLGADPDVFTAKPGSLKAQEPGEGLFFTLPLVYHSTVIGSLVLTPRRGEMGFAPTELELIENIAHQAGVAVHTVQLTAALQRSREKLVAAREEERRRLRRDLHDGLGPQLASMTLRLDASRNYLQQDPEKADLMLQELKEQVQAAIADIRRLVYDLRPPALDELGLVPALRKHAESLNRSEGLRIVVDAPGPVPALPAAVEVAAYRITLEGLTNVTHHASARECVVKLLFGDQLQLEICDDGVGLPKSFRAGVGLNSMRERAEELGGRFEIHRRRMGGTRLLAQLPLAWS